MLLKKKKQVAPYDIYIGVHDDYLYLEVFPEDGSAGQSLKIPMQKLYADEIAYALKIDNWSEIDLEGFTDKQSYSNFVQAEMPKLLAWWTHFLPRPRRKR